MSQLFLSPFWLDPLQRFRVLVSQGVSDDVYGRNYRLSVHVVVKYGHLRPFPTRTRQGPSPVMLLFYAKTSFTAYGVI